ncbi:ankyrin repeat protein [Megavirus chiliensis]|uniref:Ankyrin repeat protein n=1 Tax=Megavirus chiliensis TaxID=1094892 RepID=G5CSL5_9VIRU|nr:putative ankyrin repeat protein [Megavirus chiliensis]AEQ32409.1 ankyrin repeat protein [Megavirus chiliensis]
MNLINILNSNNSNKLYLVKKCRHKSINYQDSEGNTALTIACKYGNTADYLEIIKILLNHKDNIDHLSKKNKRSLIIACQFSNTTSNIKTVELLLDHGFDIDYTDKQGMTALMIACRYSNTTSNIETIKLLLNRGANINVQAKSGWTALMSASVFTRTDSNIETVKLLLDQGANLESINKHSYSVLTFVCRYSDSTSNTETLKLLLEKSAKVNIINKYRENLLMVACKYSTIETIEILLQHNVKVNYSGRYDWTPLKLAIKYAKSQNVVNVVKLLIKYGANVNYPTEDDSFQSVLDLAIKYNPIIIDLLLKSGINVNINNRGIDPWSLIKIYENIVNPDTDNDSSEGNCMKIYKNTSGQNINNNPLKNQINVNVLDIYYDLVKNGVNINIQDSDGLTALMLASKHYDINLIKILLDIGCDYNITDKYGQCIQSYLKYDDNKKCNHIINTIKNTKLYMREIHSNINLTSNQLLYRPNSIRAKLISMNWHINQDTIHDISTDNHLYNYFGIYDTTSLIEKVRDNIKYMD